jgi:anti-sigma-K factor RskA
MNRSHSNPHLSDDELIRLLYGLGDAESHMSACAECGERWNEMLKALGKTRAETSAAAEINGRRLALQRQEILQRVQRSSGLHAWRWVPAAAAAASVLAVALFLARPASLSTPAQPAPAVVSAEGDAQLFTDVYSMEQDVEPRAAAPIRALFQEASFEPAPSAEETHKQ